MKLTRSNSAVSIALIALSIVPSLGCSACHRSQDDDGIAPVAKELPSLELRDETADLLLTWIDKNGDYHVVQHPADVPMEGRDAVRVVVGSKTEGTAELFYVGDLRVKNQDGTYPVHSMPRSEWDHIAELRRSKNMMAAAPPSAPSPSGQAGQSPPPQKDIPAPVAPSGKLTATLYGASWCGACKEAMRYLRRRGVVVEEKDIEEDASAAKEMRQKVARAGLSGSGIPIIDIRGKILQGFDPKEIERAIASVTQGETL